MTTDNRDEETSTPMRPEALSSLASKTGAQSVTAALQRASEKTGAAFDLLYNMARRESSLDPQAKAKTSSAAGLFQFIEQTWLAAVKKYGAAHGLSEEAGAITRSSSGEYVVADGARKQAILDLRLDPSKAAALAGELIQENSRGLESRLGRAVGAAEVYTAHFLGLGGAVKLLSASPDAIAADLAPRAAAANRAVFYDGARARTVSEVMASIERSMDGGAKPAGPRMSLAEAAVRASAVEENKETDPASAASGAPWPRLEKKGAASADLSSLPGAGVAGKSSLSPLALAILKAFDPTGIGEARRNSRESLL